LSFAISAAEVRPARPAAAPFVRTQVEVIMETQSADASATRTAGAKTHTLIASDRVEGTPVRRRTGERIGTIQRLMIDKLSGNVAYAVLTFGGFLGMGRKHFPVPWARLKYDPDGETYRLDLTDDELQHAPTFEEDVEFDWGDRRHEVAIHNYYRAPHYWGY
jgi:hypothetical protein